MREKLAWGVGIAATLIAIVQANPWHEFGWTTPHQHAADVNDFRLEWRCDELQEEIDELVDLPDRTPLEGEALRRKQDAYDEQDCDHILRQR